MFEELVREVTVEIPLRQSCFALVCMIPHHIRPERKISDIQPMTFGVRP